MLTFFSIVDEPIDVSKLSVSLQDRGAGAFVTFEGRVRDHNDGLAVTHLRYEAFTPMAQIEGQHILEEAVQKFGLTGVSAVHRQGTLGLGDCAVWVGTSAPHRAEAYAASRFIIDEIKHRLPIWKKEFYADGLTAWVNCQHHDHAPKALPDLHNYYARQVKLPEIGTEGQRRLNQAKVLVVGIGGLGSMAALNLASAGIGTLGLAEDDKLEASNLHRQMIYPAAAIGTDKTKIAASQLRAHNPLINIVEHKLKVADDNVSSLIEGYDLILDCTDNFTTKYLLSDAAVLRRKTVIQASIYKFEGQMLVIDPSTEGGCLRCLHENPPDAGEIGDCAETGVLGTVPALFGVFQANEALKYILGLPVLSDGLLLFDLLAMKSQTIKRTRNAMCPICGTNPAIRELQAPDLSSVEITLEKHLNPQSTTSSFQLIDLREWDEGEGIETALRVPFSLFNHSELPFDQQTPLLLLCAKGHRSLKTAKALRAAGWEQAFSLHGGIAPLLRRA